MASSKGILTVAGDYRKSSACAAESSRLAESLVIPAEKQLLERVVAMANKQLAKNVGKPFPSWENRQRKRSPRLLCQQHMRGVRAPNIIVGKPFTFPSWAMW